MIDFLLRAVDTVLDWRIERRRRIPVVPPERFIACPDSQCARLAGHVGPHQPASFDGCLVRSFPDCPHSDGTCSEGCR